jgi:hypothetical protein
MKPFENSKTLWGDKDGDKGGELNESNLGFINSRDEQSIIDEEEEEDEEDEEGMSSEEEEDDDLLGSEHSERNFRFD